MIRFSRPFLNKKHDLTRRIKINLPSEALKHFTMKKVICLFICVSLIQGFETTAVFAQTAYAKMFPNNFGIPQMTAHPSGDIFVYGDDNFILRLSSDGTVKWQKTYLRARGIGRIAITPTDGLL